MLCPTRLAYVRAHIHTAHVVLYPLKRRMFFYRLVLVWKPILCRRRDARGGHVACATECEIGLALVEDSPEKRRLGGASRRFRARRTRSYMLNNPIDTMLKWHLHNTLHVPHLRLAGSSLQTQTGRVTLDAPNKFPPHCTFITTEFHERGAQIFVGASPHCTMREDDEG